MFQMRDRRISLQPAFCVQMGQHELAAIMKCLLTLLGCLLLICQEGCVVVIPTIPLNAPGYNHTYQVIDQHGKPIKDGFLILHSFYRASEDMFRLYPIENGWVHVPLKLGTRLNAYNWWPYFALGFTFHFENPYGTYIYPVAPGHIYDGGWQVAPWQSPEFMDGLSPPPKVLRMRRIPPDTEREDLNSLAYPAQIRLQPKEDQAARGALKEYVERRLAELPPARNVALERAITRKDSRAVRRLLDEGADVNLPHLYSLWTPIYRAVMGGDPEIIELLIQKGAQVNVLDAMGRSPLSLARSQRIRELLLRHGADPKLGKQAATQPAGKMKPALRKG